MNIRTTLAHVDLSAYGIKRPVTLADMAALSAWAFYDEPLPQYMREPGNVTPGGLVTRDVTLDDTIPF